MRKPHQPQTGTDLQAILRAKKKEYELLKSMIARRQKFLGQIANIDEQLNNLSGTRRARQAKKHTRKDRGEAKIIDIIHAFLASTGKEPVPLQNIVHHVVSQRKGKRAKPTAGDQSTITATIAKNSSIKKVRRGFYRLDKRKK